jgi:hypothetical protein
LAHVGHHLADAVLELQLHQRLAHLALDADALLLELFGGGTSASVIWRNSCSTASIMPSADCMDLSSASARAVGGLAGSQDRATDQAHAVGDFLARLRRAHRQLAHLLRHHGEAAAGRTGARRFDGRVQRQQIGLRGDAGHAFGHAAQLARKAFQVA